MVIRFFIIAIRNLVRQRQSTLISIIGLFIAFSVVIQISQWCIFELSFDKYNSKVDRIYRVSVVESRPEENFFRHSASSWQPWLSKLTDFYPEIESQIELRPMLFTTVRNSDNVFRTNKAFAIDSSVFNVFSFDFLEGSPNTALQAKNEVVVSENFAHRLFPDQDALLKVLELNTGNIDGFGKYTITGIYKDLPSNSHFHPELLIHCNKRPVSRSDIAYFYILLKEGNTIEQIMDRGREFIKEHVPEDQQNKLTIHYTSLTDIHLKSNIYNEIETNGDIKQIRLFISIGLGILLIALINYINLLLASFDRRNKYFQVNVTFGARQYHNLLLLFFESLCISVVVYIVSFIIFKPLSQLLVSTGIVKSISSGINPGTIIVSLVFLTLVLLSGIIPVFVINIRTSLYLTHNVSDILKKNTSFINNLLLVLQFTVSIVVIICSLMLTKQNKFLFSRNMGHENPNIVILTREFPAIGSQIILLKDQLLKLPVVSDVSMCMLSPGDLVKGFDRVEYADIPEKFKNQRMTILPIDDNFFSFFSIPFIAGSEKRYDIGQENGNYILNEAAIRKLGFESAEKAIGTAFKIGDIGNELMKGGTIIGVVENFNFSSLYNPIEPTIFFYKPSFQCQFFVKLALGSRDKSLALIKLVWTKIFPDYPFNYEFLDDKYNKEYRKDIITSKLVNWFTIICIVLSIIGLWGISSILVVRKTKEIGIRKVNGAKIFGILIMLNEDIVKWVMIAFVISTPVAWYVIHKWLENFSYKTELSWWIFALAGVIALVIVLTTVSLQSWRAATRNPVDALHYE
jgi:putative ABC transport system permease protein